jgi:ParB/RepB/Spo0J family partition protein
MKIKLADVHESHNKLREVNKDVNFFELADSLNKEGLLQPIKVRPIANGYELIYGHRRAMAMKHLGWGECDAIIEELDDDSALTQSIMENLHRSDMTSMEEATIYHNLIENGTSANQIANMIGKSSTYVQSRTKLLQLPDEVKSMVAPKQLYSRVTTSQGTIPIDAAGTILSASKTDEEVIQFAKKAVDENLKVNDVREISRQLKEAESDGERQQIIDEPFIPKVTSNKNGGNSKDKFHTSNRSVGEQFHSKLMWNLKRIDLAQFQHFTIGYSQRNWEQLAEILKIAEVTLLIDARRNAVSQYKPEFSKNNLIQSCKSNDLRYQHIPDLGIHKEERQDLSHTHDYDSLFNKYELRVNSSLMEKQLGNILKNERVALMCVELDPNTCHRNRLALMLEGIGYKTLDL